MKHTNKDLFKHLNRDPDLPLFNSEKQKIVIGCNYHTTWQSNKKMRFVLIHVDGEIAYLGTRKTNKNIKCRLRSLIFIPSEHNIRKSKKLRPINNVNNGKQ